MSRDVRLRIGDAWVAPSDILRYDSATAAWVPVSEGFVRVDGQWVKVWPPRAPAAADTFDSTETALWHDLSDGWHGGSWGTRPEQGSHANGGGHRGVWFYGDPAWRTALAADNGRKITKIEMYLHRTSGHLGWGTSGSVRPRLWCHGYNSRPNHKPSLFGGEFEGPGFARGEAKWITLPLSWGSWLLSGRARGFAVHTLGYGPYAAFSGRSDSVTSGRIRITHE